MAGAIAQLTKLRFATPWSSRLAINGNWQLWAGIRSSHVARPPLGAVPTRGRLWGWDRLAPDRQSWRFRTSPGAQRLHSLLRSGDGFYEEDCAWVAVAIAFPAFFTNLERRDADDILKQVYSDAWEAIHNATLDHRQSRAKDQRAFDIDIAARHFCGPFDPEPWLCRMHRNARRATRRQVHRRRARRSRRAAVPDRGGPL